MVKAVIFDMDGVLIDTEKYLVKYWVQAGREFGFDMRREHALMLRSLAGRFAGLMLQEIFGPDFDYAAVRARRKELVAAHLEKNGLEKKAFVDKALDDLHALGIKTAVATATDQVRAEAYLQEIGILHKFDRIVCAEMVKNGKPEPDIYLYACQCIGEQPQACVAIEDSPNGVLSAVRAGLRTIMVPDLTPPDAATQKLIYACAGDLGQAAEIIGRM